MLRLRPLVALVAFAVLAPAPALAAEWHAPTGGVAEPLGARRAAEAYLVRDASLDLGSVTLRFDRELAMSAHRTVRFSQRYRGLPVFEGQAAVRVAPDGRVTLAVLDVVRGLTLSVVPRVTAEAAKKAVEARFGATFGFPLATVLGVIAGDEGQGKLVYQIDVPTAKGGERYLVDAEIGRVLSSRPLAVDALGRVYAISSANTPTPTDVDLPDLVASAPQVLSGWSGNLDVTNYASGDAQSNDLKVVQSVHPSAGEDFLYDPPSDATDATDAFAQVGIYYHLTRIRDFFTSTLGVDSSAASWKLVAVANYAAGGPVDNAFFSPQGITGAFTAPNLIAIGQGSQFDFSDDSDVFLHEFTHYMSGNAIGYSEGQAGTNAYGLSTFGGSIDEGTADYFACTMNGDPILGEASLAPFNAERDLTDTHKVCPDDLLGEVHADGELIGSMTWSVHEAFGAAAGDQLVWGAMTLLTKNPSFGDFGRGLQKTADALITEGTLVQADRDTLDAILKERGLDDCDNVLDLSGGKDRKTTMFGLDVIAQGFGGSCDSLKQFGFELQSLFHFQATPAAGDTGLRFKVDLSGASNELDWSIYVRADQHVGFSSSGGFLPTVSKYDYSAEHLTATSGEVVIDASSTPPFDPAKTYYMVVGHQNCPLTSATFSASAVTPSTGEGGGGATVSTTAGAGGGSGVGGDAGAGGQPASADPVEIDGCGCSVPGSTSSGSPLAIVGGLLLAGAGLARRKTRKG